MARTPWPEWTLVHLIRRQAADQGNRLFVRFEDGQSFTFRALDAWTDELAASQAALGVRAGDRVLGLESPRPRSPTGSASFQSSSSASRRPTAIATTG